MPVSLPAALILRARSGRNLIVQTNGIEERDAVNTATAVALALKGASVSADPGDIAPLVQGLPLVCSSLEVCHGRWRVLYRTVGHMMMLLIVPSSANSLSALDFLDRAIRVVTLDFRSVETTPEKLWRRYPEIYLSLSILFQCHGCFTARRAMVEANMALDSMAPLKKAKEEKEKAQQKEADKVEQEKRAVAERKAAEKQAAADRKAEKKGRKIGNKRVPGVAMEDGVGGPQGQPGAPGAGQAAPARVQSKRMKKRPLADVASPNIPSLQQPIETQVPLRSLRALPGFEVGPRTAGGPGFHAQMAQLELEAQKQAGSLGDMLDEMFGGAPKQNNKKNQDQKKKDDPFGFVKEELGPLPPPPPPPPPVPPSPLLRLHEAWRAKVEGSMVTHVGMGGSVGWVPEAAHMLANMQQPILVVGFGLHMPPTEEQQQVLEELEQHAQQRREEVKKQVKTKGMQEQQAALTELEGQLAEERLRRVPADSPKRLAVKHALQGIWMHPAVCQQGWPPSVHISDVGFTADVTKARMMMFAPPLKYTMPAVRSPVRQPLQMTVGGSLEAVEEEHQSAALIGVSLQLAPELRGPLEPAELEVKLTYAPLYELPLRVTPPGATLDGSKFCLSWKYSSSNEQGRVMLSHLTEQATAFSAAFLVPAGLAASQGALRQVLGEVSVQGKRGTTLTGATLLQHGFYGNEIGDAMNSWSASATGRPRIPTMQAMR